MHHLFVPARRTLAALLLLLAACGDANPTVAPAPAADVPVHAITIDAESLALVEGGHGQLVATPRDAAGAPIANRPVTWASDRPSVAVVSIAGSVTAVGEGVARITASAEGKSQSVVVTVARAVVAAVRLDTVSLDLAAGNSYRLVATALGADGGVLPGRQTAWSSSDTAVAVVDDDGTVRARGWGIARVTARIDAQVADVRVSVTDALAWDLAFDAPTGAVANASELYRLDLRAPGSAAQRILPHAGASQVAPSPDGRRIAFTGTTGHGVGIFTANVDGSGVRQLTIGTALADQPAWSPDGARIAFRRWEAGASPGPFNRADIWVMNADGSGAVQLTDAARTGVSYAAPGWSPRAMDGSVRLVFSGESLSGGYLRGRIYAMRSDGTELTAVTPASDYHESEPAWSPDGRTIAFVRSGVDAVRDIWLVDVATGTQSPLFARDLDGEQFTPAWSPDGRLIAFTSKHEVSADERWTFQVYTVRADGAALVRRTETGADKARPAWMMRQ